MVRAKKNSTPDERRESRYVIRGTDTSVEETRAPNDNGPGQTYSREHRSGPRPTEIDDWDHHKMEIDNCDTSEENGGRRNDEGRWVGTAAVYNLEGIYQKLDSQEEKI